MLLAYGAKNFFCFKEWNEISLELNDKVPMEVSKGRPAALTMCLKGANGSGKTNGLKVIAFLAHFCANSFVMYKPEEKILFDSYFNNEFTTEFFVQFLIDGIEYTYELELTREKVVTEKIYKKIKRDTLVFHRENDAIILNNIYELKNQFKLRSNVSIISLGRQFEIEEMNVLYNFFAKIGSNVGCIGLVNDMPLLNNQSSFNEVAEFYFKNPDHLRFMKDTLRRYDTGIDNVVINNFENEKNEKIYYPVFFFKSSTGLKALLYDSQSSGTKKLYKMLSTYKTVLDNGGVLVLDEFDINLHPDILPHLIEYFENPITNPNNAQFIFTTHNSDIIDTMGKYRTYLFNKEDNESYCYRLDELKGSIIRNDRPISPLYKSGKIGGVPKI